MYRSTGIAEPTLQYPPELDDLDTGKNYCWKVDGMLSDVQVAQSEVWRLRVKTDKQRKDTVKYIRMKKQLDGGFITVKPQDMVYFMLEGSYRFDTLALKITGDHGASLSSHAMPLVQPDTAAGELRSEETLFTFGDHKYYLDIASLSLQEGFYTLSTIGVNNLIYYTRIRIAK
jgi:hypothetical protein